MIVETLHYSLDLIVELLDTTNGRAIETRGVLFYEEGELIPLMWKDEGLYILQNHGRYNMNLTIKVRGYEDRTIFVDYEKLMEKEPKIEVPMIPIPPPKGFVTYKTLEGKKDNLISVSVINLSDVYATTNIYSERKQIIKFINARPLNEEVYALVDAEKKSFKDIFIIRRIDNLNIRIKNPLTSPMYPGQIITRVIRGEVKGDGSFKLVYREDNPKDIYLIRYVRMIDGEPSESFEVINNEEES